MKKGDLITLRYNSDRWSSIDRYNSNSKATGIIVEVGTEWAASDVLVAWNDGDLDWVAKGNVKVISKC